MDPDDDGTDLMDGENCRWNDAASEEWTRVIEAWPWLKRSPGEWSKSGSCPRCDHGMSVLIRGSVILGAEGITDEPMQPVLAGCNCAGSHPGRPEGIERGCGHSGLIGPPED